MTNDQKYSNIGLMKMQDLDIYSIIYESSVVPDRRTVGIGSGRHMYSSLVLEAISASWSLSPLSL